MYNKKYDDIKSDERAKYVLHRFMMRDVLSRLEAKHMKRRTEFTRELFMGPF